jgi:hypothetical protein
MLGELIDLVSGIAIGRVYEDFLFTLCAEWNG